MIRGEIQKIRTYPALHRMVRVAVTATAGLAASMVAVAMPALAAGTSPGSQWVQIAAGSDHNCGIRTGGALWCWGNNGSGQLGIGNEAEQQLPRQVTTPAASGWASVGGNGGNGTCATRTTGTLWCWGNNESGQLGIGNYTNQSLPRQVTMPAAGGWASVSAGYDHSCATRTDGTLWCWGYDNSGQLGNGNHFGSDQPRQVTTPAPGGWASVTAGNGFTCATRAGGTLWCWGGSNNGQLGNGTGSSQDRPRQVTTPAPGGWASVTGGYFDTCATRAGGTLWCWGNNSYGQLGIGDQPFQYRPRQVATPAPGGWTSVNAGWYHTCATRTGGTVWCWGLSQYGELGIGRRPSQSLPQQVTAPGASGWASLITGRDDSCATRTGGALWCWGNNVYGQIGIGNYTNQFLPQQVICCTQQGTLPRPARTSGNPRR